MKIKLFIAFIVVTCTLSAQSKVEFEITTGTQDYVDCPITFDLTPLNFVDIKNLQLVEFINNSKKEIPSQITNNQLSFILLGHTPPETIRHFALIEKTQKNRSPQIEISKENGGLQLIYKNKPILNYQYKMVYPPKGVDEKYKKSGFLHPVYSPGGEVLTRIQPLDHYHHYGIWGPWTKTHIDGREVDFWNLAKGQGTVLFKEFLNETQGDAFSGFTAIQEHIDFGALSKNSVAINEKLEIKVWNLGTSKKSWLVDYTTRITSPLENGILFDAYRYGGGIGFRATEKWHKDNTSVLTSENNDRLTADGSSAKWAIIEGESNTKEGRSGILFMGFPTNKEFPEPMRVWPVDANEGRGDVFFEFCPIRHVDWKIENQKEYQLKYRILIFDGTITTEQAEMYWQAFANPPKITITANN